MLKKAKHYGDEEQIAQLEIEIEQMELQDFHHVSGFEHPELMIITNEHFPFLKATWGLMANFNATIEDGKKFWNNTLNAKSETMFEKTSFKESAAAKRCLVVVDGFYEHQHKNGKAIPHFIYGKEPLLLAGLWNQIERHDGNKTTFSIVTTKANALMSEIHNNPKLTEARMPVILNEDSAKVYLQLDAKNSPAEHLKKAVLDLCRPYGENLKAHTVPFIRGKERVGNVEQACLFFDHDAPKDGDQLALF